MSLTSLLTSFSEEVRRWFPLADALAECMPASVEWLGRSDPLLGRRDEVLNLALSKVFPLWLYYSNDMTI